MDFKEIISAINVKPYYQDDAVAIVNTPARDGLVNLLKFDIDHCITDPPYDISAEALKEIWHLVDWHTKERANLIWSFNTCRLQVIGQTLTDSWKEVRTAVWHKPFCPSPWRFGWSWHFEPIIWWQKTPDGKLEGISKYKFAESDVISVDVIRKTDDEHLNHHDQKPLALWCKLVNWFTSPNDLIIDPFLGSGTTAMAAKMLGRKCIGIEIEEKYCEIAAKRCSQSVMILETPQVGNNEAQNALL